MKNYQQAPYADTETPYKKDLQKYFQIGTDNKYQNKFRRNTRKGMNFKSSTFNKQDSSTQWQTGTVGRPLRIKFEE